MLKKERKAQGRGRNDPLVNFIFQARRDRGGLARSRQYGPF
jgi:hypothetical protein